MRQLSVIFLMIFGMFFVSCDKETAPQEDLANSNLDPAEPPSLDENFQAEVITFAFDSSELSASAQSALNSLADHMRQNTSATTQIEGHCDERGTVQYNLALGERRALSVKNFLINLGVDANRLETISYGEEKPVDPDHNASAWARNRRAEFILAN